MLNRLSFLLLTALLLWTAPAWAAITFSTSTSANADGSATTIATPAIVVTTGQVIVVAVKWESNTTMTGCADTAGNTYTLRTAQQHTTLEPSARMAYVLSATANAANVVTCTFSGGSLYRRVVVMVFNANSATMSFDVQSAASTEDDADVTPSSANVTTTGTDEVCVALHADYTNQSFSAETIDGVARDGRVTISDVDVFYRILTATLTNKAASLTKSVARRWVQQLNCFKGTGGTTPPVTITAYYVSTTGDDSRSSSVAQNIATPWRTLTKAAATMVAGETTYVRGGTYTTETYIRFATSGTPSAPITMKNYPGELPVVSWSNKTNTEHRVHLYSGNLAVPVSDIVLEGIELKNGYEGVTFERGTRAIVRKMIIHGMTDNGILGACWNCTIDGNVIYDNGDYIVASQLGTQCDLANGSPDPACNQFHGMYVEGTGWLITNNLIYDNLAYGIQANSGTVGGLPNHSGFTGLIAHNTFAYQRNRSGMTIWRNGQNFGPTTVENNIFYENSQNNGGSVGIDYTSCSGAGACTATIRNNLNKGTGVTVFVAGTCPSCTVTGTIESAPLMTNATATLPASPDFTLTATSPAIDAGYPGTGRTFNGSAPDIGRYERFGFQSATITTNTMLVTLGMNIATFNPVLPASSMTGFTVNNGRTVTAAAPLAGSDSVIALTISGAACADVDTWTVTYTPGNVTDTPGQPLSSFSAQPVTNVNCSGGAPPTAVIEQKTHQFLDAFYATGTTNVVTLSAVGATNTDLHSGIPFALAIQTDCTIANCLPLGERLYYSRTPLATGTPSAFAVVTNTLDTDQIAFYGTTADATMLNGVTPATCLSGALTASAGTTNQTYDAIPVFDLPQDGCTVNRYVLQLGASATLGDIYTFKAYNQTNVALDAYTPSGGAKITVTPVAANSAPAGLHEVGAASNTIIEMVWTPSTITNLAGYKVYQCTTTPCTAVDAHLVATLTAATAMSTHSSITAWRTTISTAGTYYFVVTVFDTGFQESAASSEIAVVRTGQVPRTAR